MTFAALVLLTSVASAETPVASRSGILPNLSEAVSSFGAAVQGDSLYVYSGHTGEAHAHSKANLSPRFERLPLASAAGWESLPAGPALQSVALVAHGKYLYRVGGLSARNEPGATEELVSVTDFARFDPVARTWTALTPLPAGRSSHDAVVVGDRLYVVGGWNLGKGHDWHVKALSIDLADDAARWVELPPQPFERRALAVAAHGNKLFAIGGMGSDNQPSLQVDCFDLASQSWSKGPAVPGKGMDGFGCAAVGAYGALYLTTMDGRLHRLAVDGRAWQPIGALQEPRFFHRLLPCGSNALLAVAGASHTVGHLDSIERIELGDAR